MAELSDYEKMRAQNIASNNDVLKQLGLCDDEYKFSKSITSKPKQSKSDVERVVQQPTRMMPKRGGGPATGYKDFFAESDKLIDDLEREEKQRIKYERKTGKRQISEVERYDDSTYEKPARPRKKRDVTNYTYMRLPPRPHVVIDEDDILLSKQQLAKLFAFRFTSDQLKQAGYKDELVDTFQRYCDERAHLRFECLTKQYSNLDIVALAKAISELSDLSSFDVCLVKDYEDAVKAFKQNPDKLAPPTSYKSINPKVYCGGCDNIFAYTDNGTIRNHKCYRPTPEQKQKWKANTGVTVANVSETGDTGDMTGAKVEDMSETGETGLF